MSTKKSTKISKTKFYGCDIPWHKHESKKTAEYCMSRTKEILKTGPSARDLAITYLSVVCNLPTKGIGMHFNISPSHISSIIPWVLNYFIQPDRLKLAGMKFPGIYLSKITKMSTAKQYSKEWNHIICTYYPYLPTLPKMLQAIQDIKSMSTTDTSRDTSTNTLRNAPESINTQVIDSIDNSDDNKDKVTPEKLLRYSVIRRLCSIMKEEESKDLHCLIMERIKELNRSTGRQTLRDLTRKETIELLNGVVPLSLVDISNDLNTLGYDVRNTFGAKLTDDQMIEKLKAKGYIIY